MKNCAVLLSLVVAFLTAQAAFAQPAGNPLVQNMAPMDNAWHLVKQTDYFHKKFPAFSGRYNDWVRYQDVPQEIHQEVDGSQRSLVNLLDGDQYRQRNAPGQNKTRVQAHGIIEPSGYYVWDIGYPWGRYGHTLNPTLAMPGYTTNFAVPDSGYVGPQLSMLDLVDPTHVRRTTSITNAEYALIEAGRSQLTNELRGQPDRWRQAMLGAQEAKQSSQSNQTASGAESNTNAGWDNISMPLLNIANEQAWIPCDPEAAYKSYANAAWMVGQMYKQVYIPMAILLLLPGAVLTQVKVVVRTGFVPEPRPMDEDLLSPFSGLLRSVIAIFLIPATQLFVSYTIDVGNSLTYEVTHSPEWVNGGLEMLKEWRNEQTYDTKYWNQQNHIENTPEGDMQDKMNDTYESEAKFERQHYPASTNQQWFNTMNALLGQGVVILNAFQIIMMMYLFLLGPVAAALYTWPGIGKDVFREVYAKWMDGVVLVTLWKFWWAVIMLAMMVRLRVNDDNSVFLIDWNDQFEMYMCAAFCGILMYVPFNPFDFRPGDAISQVLDQAQGQLPKGGASGHTGGSAGQHGSGGTGGTGGGSAGVTGHGH